MAAKLGKILRLYLNEKKAIDMTVTDEFIINLSSVRSV